jgi:hypothetical protein
MATYYFTLTDEDPAVYHDDPTCPEGTRIDKQNRVETVVIPTGRKHCDICGT